MSFINILDAIFLDPITSLFEMIFYFSNYFSHSVYLTIVLVAVFMNFIFLPISIHAATYHESVYKNAFNAKCNKLGKKPNEKPNIKIPLNYFLLNMLKVLFFVASLEFFGKLSLLEELGSGFFAKPDALIKIGNLKFNLFPILMALINIVLFALTYKSSTLWSKFEKYLVLSVLFVAVYNASAGLVLFWIITNVFYLLKLFLGRYKTFRNMFKYILSLTGLLLIGSCIFDQQVIFIIVGGLLQIPTIYYVIRYKVLRKLIKPKNKKKPVVYKTKKYQFYVEAALIIFLLGVFIPSTYVAASPQEYINSKLYFNPLNYVLGSFLTSFGYIMIWINAMYSFSTEKNKYRLNKLLMVSIVIMLVNYMFFGLNLGTISFTLKYDFGLDISILEAVINAIVVIAIVVVFMFVYAKLKEYLSFILALIIVVLSVMSTFNIITSASQIKDYKNGVIAKSKMSYELSKTGNNVVVIMLDRALGQYLPFIMNERPELAEKFDGFTHYKNTISFGFFTNIASPALLGGYEYTPVEINKRDDELLKDKNNEANLVMPRIFSEAGYNVTVADPVYIDYKFATKLSIYDKYKNINAFYSIGKFVADDQIEFVYDYNMTNFFRFSFMKTLPLALQYLFYDDGNYNNVQSTGEMKMYTNQKTSSVSKATGIKNTFMNNYLTLQNMDTMTNITSDKTNTFLFFRNDITHEETLLDAANNYTPNYVVDNTEFDALHSDRFVLPNGQKLDVTNENQMMHYHVNMAAMIELGNWFDYLRENGTYDNTRIIVVSDHGRDVYSVEGFNYGGESLEMCAPLLMVKDFNETGFRTSNEFMTNADVATLATRNLGFTAKNPFTGKEINMNEKTAHSQYISTSYQWDTSKNNGNTFMASTWLSFDSTKADCNIYDKNCWSYLDKKVTLKSHSF